MEEASDAARFERVAAGLVEPLRRFLLRRTDAATADDVLADTLLVCWRRVEELPEDPLPWAYGVARNCLANAERGARRRRRLAARVVLLDPPVAVTVEPDATDDTVLAALSGLRPDDAELLRLWAWEQLAPGEIAAVLAISPNAVSIRLHRARRRLRDALGKQEPASGHKESREGRQP